ncbi:MAG: hypothetical protein LQ340_006844 [Diploschistes diacapsis]|nr:MAG: hypothetical protein LQ340_006844 [Diploschistes diacapsis]
MESFQYLADNIPQWIDRLELLSHRVSERQTEFNRLSQSSAFSGPPMRKQKTGSTESLRPVDGDGVVEISAYQPDVAMPPPPTPSTPPARISIDPRSRRLFQDHRDEKRRKRKSASLLSGASGPQKYRARLSLIVYYDSHIQQEFEWLVRGVASARNKLHKGKVTTGYKARMASLRTEVDPSSGDRVDFPVRAPTVPLSQQSSSRRSALLQALEQFDTIDKDLEAAQTLCELGAHQFLRDANCDDELATTREHFENSLGVAREQMDLLRAEEEENRLLHAHQGSGEGSNVDGNNPAEADGVHMDTVPSRLHQYGSNGMGIEIDDGNGIEVDTGVEIDGDTHPSLPNGGAVGNGAIEIDNPPRPTNNGGHINGGIEVDTAPSTSSNPALSSGVIEVDDAPTPLTKGLLGSGGGGGGGGGIEIDDDDDDDDDARFQIDMAAFLRSRRR